MKEIKLDEVVGRQRQAVSQVWVLLGVNKF